MKIRETGKKSNLKLHKKENMSTRRDANTYCPFFQSSMQNVTFYVRMSYNLNFHRCSSLKARKMSPSGSGLVTLNTSELTTLTAPSQYSRIKIMNFPERAQSNPILPYPATSVTLEKQLTARRAKPLLETRLMCYIWCTSGKWKTSLEHSKQVSRNSSTLN